MLSPVVNNRVKLTTHIAVSAVFNKQRHAKNAPTLDSVNAEVRLHMNGH